MRWQYLIAALVTAVVAGGCTSGGKTTPYKWTLPDTLPLPVVPADNPMTVEKVTLGRYLFYEKRLSGNQSYACSNCHQQRNAFTDGRVAPVGSTGTVLPRNTMPLVNAAYMSMFMWANPLLTSLEEQILVPMFSDAPVEMGMGEYVDVILARLAGDADYQRMFKAAYPDDKDPFTLKNVIYAITSFERTLLSASSPFDKYQAGDTTAISDSAARGFDAVQHREVRLLPLPRRHDVHDLVPVGEHAAAAARHAQHRPLQHRRHRRLSAEQHRPLRLHAASATTWASSRCRRCATSS